jgi:hypothetical protein
MADDVATPLQAIPASKSNGRTSIPRVSSPLGLHPSHPSNRSMNHPDAFPRPPQRRSSLLSDYSLDDARHSIRSSTDDLLLPKAQGVEHEISNEGSHWQSVPLAFALLPAIGGMLFKNGSAIITDIILLGLAAVFLNWSVRLPWDWYKSAQSVRIRDGQRNSELADLEQSDEEDNEAVGSPASETGSTDGLPQPKVPKKKTDFGATRESAAGELQIHEVLALLSCFLGPLCGAYLLHTIRAQLSRPSEGLVSNYNLTIFLMAAEVRPLSHLVKMVQSRTLHLQRLVNANPYQEDPDTKVQDINKRLDDLEARGIVDTAPSLPSEGQTSPKTTASVTTDVRRTLQPDLDALNRAVRRYEKRVTIQTMQTESRLQDLELRLADALSLAAAAAQSGQRNRPGMMSILADWMVAAIFLPLQAFWGIVSFPAKSIGRLVGIGKKGPGGSSERERRSTSKYGSHGRLGGERIQGRGLRR